MICSSLLTVNMNVAQSPPNYFKPFSPICNIADLTFLFQHFPFFIKEKKSFIYFHGSPPLSLSLFSSLLPSLFHQFLIFGLL